MYPDQIKIIKQFIPKFDCIQNHIISFIREYRLAGVEYKKCSMQMHDMCIGDTAYVYDGKAFGLNSVYCSDLECFLDNLDESSVKKYMESEKSKKPQSTKK